MARLLEKYRTSIVGELAKKLGRENPMDLPRLQKIVVSMGVGKATENRRRLDQAAAELGQITGQKAMITKARKSVSAFKVRQGNAIGCKVTLRGQRMYEFLDRLVSIAIPRIRDFRGLPRKSFDGRGNYTLGLSEQTVFPEINLDKVEFVQGMDITLVTTARSDSEAFELLRAFGMPFRN
jgi:large subunit ribosomal protein L5